jgi:signal transduction histidine kinase/CheY-like chemotaxis protein/ligand-binding sensor domain-containing protein
MRLFALISLGVFLAGASEPPLLPSQYVIDSWGPADRLPEETISRIIQTPDGYLWMSSANGLIRFDGHDFEVFHPPRAESGVTTRVLAVVPDADWSLVFYVAFRGLFRMRDGQIRQLVDIPNGPPLSFILVADPDGGPPLCYLPGGLFRVTDQGLRLWQSLPDDVSPVALAHSSSGWLVASRDQRLLVARGDPHPLRTIPLPVRPQALAVGEEGSVWVGTASGVVRLLPRGEQYVAEPAFAPEFAIRHFLPERPGRMWIATESGLLLWRNGAVDDFSRDTSFPRLAVGTLFRDREGCIWASSNNGRLFRIRKPRFPSWGETEGLTRRILSLDETAGEWTWFGQEGALARWRRGVVEPVPGPWTKITPRLLLRDQTGGLIVLSLTRMARVDEATLRVKEISLPATEGTWILLFRRPSDGSIWLGNTEDGLFLLEGDAVKPVRIEGLPKLRPRAVMTETAEGRLYLSNRGVGFYEIKQGRAHPLAATDPASRWIHSVYPDSSNNLWLGFDGGGIGRWRNGRLERFTLDPEAPENTVYQLAEDHQGYLWLGLRAGLTRMAKADLIRYLEQGGIEPARLRFDVPGGLRSANFGLAFNVIHGHPQRLFWLAHLNGALRIDAANVPVNTLPPPVNIRRVVANGKPASLRGRLLALPPRLEHLQIFFDAPSLIDPSAVRYRYQLAGFQHEAIGWVLDRQASYLKLPPGRFEFRVWAKNGDGFWNPDPATITIEVQPALTETAAFKLLLLLAATAMVAGIITLRTRWLRREKQRLEESVRERTAQLEQARREAESAARSKSEFLAMMSHEIRTPLHGVLGTLELLSRGRVDGPEREYVATAQRSGEVLLTLLNDVLDLSRLEAHRMELHGAPFSLRSLVNGVADGFRHQAQLKGIAMVTEFGDHRHDLFVGDEARLRQILYNLVGNAVKFTEQGSVKIGVAAERRDESSWDVRIAVSDTGIGIAPEQLGGLFQPFAQADGSTTRRFGGSGLGLAISRRLAELMGGSLTVESRLGEGSTFLLSLPLPATHSLPAPSTAPAQLEERFAAKVLLVEDNRVNQLVAKRMLEQLGCEVDFASDGLQALEQTLRSTYDLILMDCHMPRMDGIEATRRIRSGNSPNAHTPIVALTASTSQEDLQRCLDAGMQSLIGKPFHGNDLALALREFTRRSAH